MSLWRIHTRTDYVDLDVRQYCRDNSVAVLGWSLNDKQSEKYLNESGTSRAEFDNKRNEIDSPEKFEELEFKVFKKESSSVKRLMNVEENDLIWMRSKGKYYLGRVQKDSKWVFNKGDVEKINDIANQLTNIKWYEASETADESSVPGAVTTAFIKGSAFQRINKSGVEDYSKLLYNDISHEEIYKDVFLNNCISTFYSLLQPSDLEDLLCMYLYNKYHYITVPSTNKLSTQLYECVLIDPENKEPQFSSIYIQVKKGNVDLDFDDYKDLNGKIYLLTTEGKYKNKIESDRIIAIDPEVLYKFAIDEENRNCIPEKIKKWLDLMKKYDSSANCKGIIIDTNLSHSNTNEKEMLKSKQVCAYGNASRYINSYNIGDYALLYSKGKGVVAIGKVTSKQPIEIEDGLAHDLEYCVPVDGFASERELRYLRARTINELLGHNLYYASTMKVPFLKDKEVKLLIDKLKKEYGEE